MLWQDSASMWGGHQLLWLLCVSVACNTCCTYREHSAGVWSPKAARSENLRQKCCQLYYYGQKTVPPFLSDFPTYLCRTPWSGASPLYLWTLSLPGWYKAKQQLNDIKSKLANVNQKIAKVETQIEETENCVQNVEQVLNKMIKVINRQENKLLDQEGRSRWENVGIYNVPEGAAGSAMVEFVYKLLRDMLEIPPTTSLDIEKAHRALTSRPPQDREDKPRSIIIRFLRYKTKEEILRKVGKEDGVFQREINIFWPKLPTSSPAEAQGILLSKASVEAEKDPFPDSVPC